MTAPLPEVNLPEGDYLEKDAYVQQYAKAAVREALERAAKLCMDERVDADATKSDEDEAYNLACTHCFGTIRAMLKEYSDD